MEVIPNKAPQKAYILQPVEGKKEESISFICLFLLIGRLCITSICDMNRQDFKLGFTLFTLFI